MNERWAFLLRVEGEHAKVNIASILKNLVEEKCGMKLQMRRLLLRLERISNLSMYAATAASPPYV
jgi:hypothetical protein